MILYTEGQLQHAYIEYVRMMHKQHFVIVPTIEEFREIYETELQEQYEENKKLP